MAWTINVAMLGVALAFWYLRRTSFANLSIVVEGLDEETAKAVAVDKVVFPIIALFAALTSLVLIECCGRAENDRADEKSLVEEATTEEHALVVRAPALQWVPHSDTEQEEHAATLLVLRNPNLDRLATFELQRSLELTATVAEHQEGPTDEAEEPEGVGDSWRETCGPGFEFARPVQSSTPNAFVTVDESSVPMQFVPWYEGNGPPESPGTHVHPEEVEATPVVSPPLTMPPPIEPWDDPMEDAMWTAVAASLPECATIHPELPERGGPSVDSPLKRDAVEDPPEERAATDPLPPSVKRARHGDAPQPDELPDVPVAAAASTELSELHDHLAISTWSTTNRGSEGWSTFAASSEEPAGSGTVANRVAAQIALTPQAAWLVPTNDPDAWKRCFLSDKELADTRRLFRRPAPASDFRAMFQAQYDALQNGVVGISMDGDKHIIAVSPLRHRELNGDSVRQALKLRSLVERALDELLVILSFIEESSHSSASTVWAPPIPPQSSNAFAMLHRQQEWDVMLAVPSSQRRSCRLAWPPTHALLRLLALHSVVDDDGRPPPSHIGVTDRKSVV